MTQKYHGAQFSQAKVITNRICFYTPASSLQIKSIGKKAPGSKLPGAE